MESINVVLMLKVGKNIKTLAKLALKKSLIGMFLFDITTISMEFKKYLIISTQTRSSKLHTINIEPIS